MTPEYQFILQLVSILATAVVTVLTFRKTAQTHDMVNGMQAKKVRQARRSGLAAGKRTVVPLQPPEARE